MLLDVVNQLVEQISKIGWFATCLSIARFIYQAVQEVEILLACR